MRVFSKGICHCAFDGQVRSPRHMSQISKSCCCFVINLSCSTYILLLDFPCPFAHGVFIPHYMPSSPGQVIIIRAAVTQNVENASQNDSQTRCIVVTGQCVAAG